jgi:transcriptional regulator with XRE-family HTH domain
VPRRDDPGTKPETKLARARLAAKLTQAEMVEATGISRSFYWRLERGRVANPPLRHLTNCALVLDVAVEELIEDEWRTIWLQLAPGGPARMTIPASAQARREKRERDEVHEAEWRARQKPGSR